MITTRKPNRLVKASWKEEFIVNIRRNPKIKDPAYVEWLAALSFTVIQENLNVAKLAEVLGLCRTYVYPILKGKHVARQDVMDKAASLAGLPLDEFRAYGRKLLGGAEIARDVLKFIVIDRYIDGYAEGKVVTSHRPYEITAVARRAYHKSWGDMRTLAVFVGKNNRAIVDLSGKDTVNVLAVDSTGALKVVAAEKLSSSITVVGAILYIIPDLSEAS